ncbi:YchJ family protein [Microbacterium sp. PA5]|uniref:YchJ family protein n=1 Tax=Microbacterium sp. PA5 TaxID=3416654 RepID=UPI003CF4037F
MAARSSSFSGSAFGARARRTPADADACPCGAGRFGDCCGPVLGGAPAPTALALMRSRYTAFALGARRHLEDTWHPSTRPTRLDLDDDLEWSSLTIDEVVGGEPGDRRGVVAFRARWRDGRSSGELAERSRFVFQQGRWWYVDGEVG